MQRISEVFGRLHPVLLHFPIALLWAAAVAELARARRESPLAARMVIWLLGAGAILAVGASATGWVLAVHDKVRSDERATLELHRWFAVATSVVALIAWSAATAWRESPNRAQVLLRRLAVFTAAVLVSLAGHLGAMIVWGKDWWTF